MKNIVLVGLMGAGKSTIGKFLAEKLNYNFIDTDITIETEQKLKIPTIFEKYGEEHFRQLENKLVLKLSQYSDTIISTGGGLVQNTDNIKNLSKNSFIIYLQANPNTLFERIQNDNNRPLLQNTNPLKTLKELLNKREKNYKLANLTINTENKSIKNIGNEILKEYYANN